MSEKAEKECIRHLSNRGLENFILYQTNAQLTLKEKICIMYFVATTPCHIGRKEFLK